MGQPKFWGYFYLGIPQYLHNPGIEYSVITKNIKVHNIFYFDELFGILALNSNKRSKSDYDQRL